MAGPLDRAARLLALAGGAGLLALVGMICVSALGALALMGVQAGWLPGGLAGHVGPFKASYEVVEIALPPIVFALLPWVQARAAHARVSVLTRGARGLDRLWLLLAALLLAVICWRLGAGMLARRGNGDGTFLLAIPLWLAYGACLPGAALAALIAARDAWRGPSPPDSLPPDSPAPKAAHEAGA